MEAGKKGKSREKECQEITRNVEAEEQGKTTKTQRREGWLGTQRTEEE